MKLENHNFQLYNFRYHLTYNSRRAWLLYVTLPLNYKWDDAIELLPKLATVELLTVVLSILHIMRS